MTITTVVETIDVEGPASTVWQIIGSFDVETWHPLVERCTVDAEDPPTRTIETKGDNGTFIESQTMRDDVAFMYSYRTISGPLPVDGFVSTIKVVGRGPDSSTISWDCAYTLSDDNAASATEAAVRGIFTSGLDSVAAQLT